MSAPRCPGLARRGAQTSGARAPHNGGCCAAFAALSRDEKQRRAAAAGPAPQRLADRPVPPDLTTVTLSELTVIVAGLQRQAEITGVLEQPATLVNLDIAPDESLPQALALIDLGAPYGLIAGWRQLRAPQQKGTAA